MHAVSAPSLCQHPRHHEHAWAGHSTFCAVCLPCAIIYHAAPWPVCRLLRCLLVPAHASQRGNDQQAQLAIGCNWVRRRRPVLSLIAQQPDINHKAGDSWTSLHRAAANGCASVCQVLIKQSSRGRHCIDSKADIDARDSSNQTPLHRAVMAATVAAASMARWRSRRRGGCSRHLVRQVRMSSCNSSSSSRWAQERRCRVAFEAD